MKHIMKYWQVDFKVEDFPSTKPTYVGPNYKEYYNLQWYIDEGYKVIEWDGM